MSAKNNEDRFFSELKQRNVYKVAIAYAIVAWLLIQAASILFPTFEGPAWVMKVFVTAVILGFPVALVFAWAFEITLEGIKRADEVSSDKSITRKTGRRLTTIIVMVAVVAAGLLIFQFTRKPSVNTKPPVATDSKSVAVLSLENLSSDISWTNNTEWTREPRKGGPGFGQGFGAGPGSGSGGRWYHDGKPTSISVSSGGRVTITNEHGQTSSGSMSGNELVISSLRDTRYCQ